MNVNTVNNTTFNARIRFNNPKLKKTKNRALSVCNNVIYNSNMCVKKTCAMFSKINQFSLILSRINKVKNSIKLPS